MIRTIFPTGPPQKKSNGDQKNCLIILVVKMVQHYCDKNSEKNLNKSDYKIMNILGWINFGLEIMFDSQKKVEISTEKGI